MPDQVRHFHKKTTLSFRAVPSGTAEDTIVTNQARTSHLFRVACVSSLG